MEIYAHKALRWTIELTFKEREEISRIANLLKTRPTELIRLLIQDGLKTLKAVT